MNLENTFQCSFTGCQFYVAGSDHITGDGNVHGLLVTTSSFEGAYNWGINLASAYNIIVNNSFANTSGGQGNGDSSVPRGGNINGASGSNNINKGNQGGAGAVLL